MKTTLTKYAIISLQRSQFSHTRMTIAAIVSYSCILKVTLIFFCSPFRLCKAVDDKLAATLEDAQHFILDGQKAQGPEVTKRTSVIKVSDLSSLTRNKTSSNETDPFDRFGDSCQIQSFLQETCFSAFNQ